MLNLAKERLPDLTEFYTTGEGFASWNHKVALWTQHRPQYHYPEIELKLGKDNSPSLLDPSVVPYINDQKVGSCLRILINSDNHHDNHQRNGFQNTGPSHNVYYEKYPRSSA